MAFEALGPAGLDPSHPGSRKSLELLRNLIEERLGMHFSDENLPLLADRLGPRALHHNLFSYLDYYYLLKYDEEGAEEWPVAASALTTNETYFWREPDAIQLVARELVPELQATVERRPVRIWHAASATGEEPYSLALALQEAGCFERGPIEILATDLDREVLAAARQGIYRERSVRSLPAELQERYLRALGGGLYELDPEVRQRVSFRPLNLARTEEVGALMRQDVIFCRNVLIYFRDPVIQTLALQLYDRLQTPGYLFLGASESLLRYTQPFDFFQRAGVIAYRKQP